MKGKKRGRFETPPGGRALALPRGRSARSRLSGARHPLPRRHRVGADSAATIKSHHNVVVFPRLAFDLVEPLRSCSRTRCGRWARSWPAPRHRVRQPFPGPAAVRSSVSDPTGRHPEGGRCIVVEEIRRAALPTCGRASQCFRPSFGRVMGDGRTLRLSIIIRAVTSDDAMTPTGPASV